MKRIITQLLLSAGVLCISVINAVPALASTVADTLHWETVIDTSSFSGYKALEEKWNYLYPWGADHNGTARMYASNTDHSRVTLLSNHILRITATRITADEGKSASHPFLPIRYHAGTIHAKHQVTVSEEYPEYEISGSFKAPVTKGTWPAFWLTSVKGWPPELDILEFKGDAVNWQNTFITPKQVTTIKTNIADAPEQWHRYAAILKKVDDKDLDIYYYIDDRLTGVHRCNFTNKPLWIIINLQMEGSSGEPGPADTTYYYIKDILVRRAKK